jgi:diguanylate cyclase (GGDEF)-like protein
MQLHSRIFLLVLVMLLGLGATSTLFLYNSTRQRVEADVADSLSLARRSFADSFADRQNNLIERVQTVVDDWGLRQAIGQRDESTVESMLQNHSSRVGAEVAVFIDLDHQLFASTTRQTVALSQTAAGLASSINARSQLRFVVIDGQCYQLVLTEVLAPVPVGWLGMGFVIDDAMAVQFSRMNEVGVSFVLHTSSEARVFASSISEPGRFPPTADLHLDPHHGERQFWIMAGAGWEDLATYQILEDDQSKIGVVLQKSLSEPLASFRSWWWSLLTIFGLIAGLALLVAYFFSRGITRPMTELLVAIENMQAGNYTTSIDIQRKDEIGFLAKAFAKMQSAIAEREEEIRYRADHDLVTGVHNRNGFIDFLERRVASAGAANETLVVLSFSVNHFKQIVDALGHTWGDKLLEQVADRFSTHFPDGGVAHLNSDEFAMIVPSTSVSSVFVLGENVHECLAGEFTIRGISLSLSASVGVSVYPEHATDAQSLLRRAGVAMNEAMLNFQRTIVYDSSLDQNNVKRLTLMSELPNAIREKQLTLHYQPKLQCTSAGVLIQGAECLVRWNHPELGLVPPDEFIGLAEKTGYIVELTKYVMSEAIAQCAEWRRKGWALTVSVNISALDLQREEFAKETFTALKEHRLPATALCLEVTESAAMEDPESAIQRLATLKNLGVRLSIDDYGTGYSSLAHLKKLPVHELKIDKSFVLELDRNEDDQTIVRSTIELAHNVGLEVVAEGVESQRILWQLEKWGCNYLQGFHISKPLPLEQFEEWLDRSEFPISQPKDQQPQQHARDIGPADMPQVGVVPR